MLFVLVTDKSATGASGLVTVPELLAGFESVVPAGGVTVAVLTSEPVALLETVAVSVNVAEPLANNVTVVLMLPVPLAAPQLEPAEAVQVHVALLNVFGKSSVTVALVATLGPAFVTTMV